MKIDFLIGENPYQSTLHFARKFGEALKRQNVDIRFFDVREGHFYHAFYTILNDPPDLTCSFSDITVADGLPLGDQWQIPHLSFLVDPAIYFLHQLKGEYSLITCVDQEDCVFARHYCPRVLFLPHGIESTIKDREEKRIYEVALLGTCTDYEEVKASWRMKFPLKIARGLEAAAERVLSPEPISSLNALIEMGFTEDLPLLHHELDLYIGGKDRVELARAFKGLSLHIWGTGPWKKYLPQAIVHPALSFNRTLAILQKTKLLLNSSPRFKNGSHERIFYGLASGALVVTGDNPYINEQFADGETLLTYQHGRWEEGISKINRILADESRRLSIVSKGKEKVLFCHTWDHRAHTLIKWLKHL